MLPKLTINYSIDGSLLENVVISSNVLPGMLLERLPLSPEEPWSPAVRPHSIVNGRAAPLIAVERPESNYDIDSLIEVGNIVSYYYCLPGDVFIGILDDNNWETVTAGTLLSSAGNGKLCPIPEGMLHDRTIIGYALASADTVEMYNYFAINDVSLEEVYARAESEYYLGSQETVALSKRIAVEVI